MISALIKSSWSAIHVPPLSKYVVSTLRAIAHDSATDVRDLISFLRRQLANDSTKLSDDVRGELAALRESLEGHDFPSKLRRFVKFSTPDDYHNDGVNACTIFEKNLEELVTEAIRDPEILFRELSWIVSEDSNAAYSLAASVGQRDPEKIFFGDILKCYREQNQIKSTAFLAGYLAAFFHRDRSEWETEIAKLADDPRVAPHFADLVRHSGISDAIVRKIVQLCRSGCLETDRLNQWSYLPKLRELGPAVFQELLQLLLQHDNPRSWKTAVEMCYVVYCEKDCDGPIPEELGFQNLDKQSDDRGSGYSFCICVVKIGGCVSASIRHAQWIYFSGCWNAAFRNGRFYWI